MTGTSLKVLIMMLLLLSLSDHPDVWTDGSSVLDRLTGVSASGAGFFANHSEHSWNGRRWGHVHGVLVDRDLACCRGFSSVPGPLQSVQRAEMWGVILALQASRALHLGVDNLGVVRHVGRLLDGCRGAVPFQLVNDGDLLLLIDHMLRSRGLDTVCISKVKGHADDGMVLHGQVRREDKLGKDAADEAADFWTSEGQSLPSLMLAVICLEVVVAGTLSFLIFTVFSLLFLVLWVNHDDLGGTAPHPLVWSAGALRKRRRLVFAVRDRAFLPGPPRIWYSEWCQVPSAVVSSADVDLWPYTPGLLVKWVSSLNTFHWPVVNLDLGVGGISYVELLILYELWAGERLRLEKAHPRYLRPGRRISVSAVPFGPGIDIWRSCRFIGALMRALCLLPGGLGRFVPCSIGANYCRLRHIGWEKCGHGITSIPRESASELFLNELLTLFRYPPKSGRALLNGTLPLRYCAARFANSTPTWRLPVSGQVRGLVAAYPDTTGDLGDEVVDLRVFRGSRSGPGGKRFRLNRKTPAHLVKVMVQSRPRVWKRLHHVGISGSSLPDHTRRRCDHAYGGSVQEHDRTGVG